MPILELPEAFELCFDVEVRRLRFLELEHSEVQRVAVAIHWVLHGHLVDDVGQLLYFS